MVHARQKSKIPRQSIIERRNLLKGSRRFTPISKKELEQQLGQSITQEEYRRQIGEFGGAGIRISGRGGRAPRPPTQQEIQLQQSLQPEFERLQIQEEITKQKVSERLETLRGLRTTIASTLLQEARETKPFSILLGGQRLARPPTQEEIRLQQSIPTVQDVYSPRQIFGTAGKGILRGADVLVESVPQTAVETYYVGRRLSIDPGRQIVQEPVKTGFFALNIGSLGAFGRAQALKPVFTEFIGAPISEKQIAGFGRTLTRAELFEQRVFKAPPLETRLFGFYATNLGQLREFRFGVGVTKFPKIKGTFPSQFVEKQFLEVPSEGGTFRGFAQLFRGQPKPLETQRAGIFSIQTERGASFRGFIEKGVQFRGAILKPIPSSEFTFKEAGLILKKQPQLLDERSAINLAKEITQVQIPRQTFIGAPRPELEFPKTEQLQMFEIQPKEREIMDIAQITETGKRIRGRTRAVTIPKFAIETGIKTTPILRPPATVTRLGTIQRILQEPIPRGAFDFGAFDFPSDIPFPKRGFLLPPIPILPSGASFREINVFKGFKQPKGFKPTLFSISFGIKGVREPFGELTGLGIRPIPTRKRRRRKR